jgi:uncharacterized protein YcbK (DUF882 family)
MQFHRIRLDKSGDKRQPAGPFDLNRIERHNHGRHSYKSVWSKWLVAILATMGFLAASMAAAKAEVRSLKLYHLHTHEKAEIVYKRNGRYIPAGLKKINYILRDWRRNEVVKMDPRLLDLVWEAYRASGATGYINVICGYRAPETNSMLRSRSRGVAKKSQHVLGKAMDFYIPGVPLKKLRDIGLKMQGGGVGYYPTSGSPFVHMDVGNVRHWPGISRKELVRVFPNGKTLHVPSDGRPLPGYEQALAAYKARKRQGEPAIALASAGGTSGKSHGLLAALFGGGADEADDEADVASAAPAPKASASKPAKNLPGIAVVAPQDARRANVQQVAEEDAGQESGQGTPETIMAALPARDVPLPAFAPRPKADVGVETPDNIPFGMAQANPTEADNTAAVQVAAAAPQNLPFGMTDAGTLQALENAGTGDAGSTPLPTWRPDEARAIASLKPQPVLMAMAEAPKQASLAGSVFSALPSRRPDNGAGNAGTDEVKALLEKASAEQAGVASLSANRSVFSDPSGVDAASPKLAVVERPAGTAPAVAVAGTVRTTPKEARASSADAKPQPRTMVVAAAPQVARWALHSTDYVATVRDSTTAPRFAYNIVRTPPSEVYTVGFEPNNEVADSSHFSGSAVKFLSVARFK